jgi:hypothetical protein
MCCSEDDTEGDAIYVVVLKREIRRTSELDAVSIPSGAGVGAEGGSG